MASAPTKQATSLPFGLTPKTYWVTGKGGVGKSTIAATMAIAFRDAGYRTLLIDLTEESNSSAANVLTDRAIGYEPEAVSPALFAMRMNATKALQEYAQIRLRIKSVANRLVGNPVIEQFAQAAPGFRELLILGKIWALANETQPRSRHPRYEAIIVDAPATGHGMGLLRMAGIVARMFVIGPVAAEAREVDEFVTDPDRSEVVLVSLPEELPVTETIQLASGLVESNIPIAKIIANCVTPERYSNADLIQLQEAQNRDLKNDDVSDALWSAIADAMRHSDQKVEIDRLTTDLSEYEVVKVPEVIATDDNPRLLVNALAELVARQGGKA